MASYLAEKMSAFSSLNKYGVACLTTLICSLVTELASNMATVNLLMPIFFSLSDVIKCNPILLGHPAAIAASHTFLLPVGTPMNAMVSAYANIRTPDFFLAGIMLKIAAYGLLMAAFLTYGQLFWNIDKMPNWAKDNTTSRII